MDNNSKTWKKTIDERGMSTDNQYLLNKSTESEICKYYLINAIPRFIIIDADARLVTAKASRPSDNSIKEELVSLLKVKTLDD